MRAPRIAATLVVAVVLATAAACGSSPRPAAGPAAGAAAAAPRAGAADDPMTRARALERGDGVARDYAAAVAIYEPACAWGAGQLAACRRLLHAVTAGRGADVDLARAARLARAMCLRDDLLGCVADVMLNRGQVPADELARAQRLIEVPCDAAHLDRCETDRAPFTWFDQSSSADDAEREFDARGCALGVLDACARLRYATGPEHDDAVVRLGDACDHGDATACAAVDRPIDAARLCAAHDYDACATAGCAGDPTAADTAEAHGVEADCTRNDRRAYAIEHPAPTGVTPAPRPRFQSLDFRQLGGRGKAEPRYQIVNAGTRPIALAIGTIYVYDAAGTLLANLHFEQREPLDPGRGTTMELGGPTGASFEGCLEVVQFADEAAGQLARCPASKPRGARWGDGGDTVELRVDLSGIPLADDWTGTLEPALAEPFEATHAGVRVREVSGDDVPLWLGSASDDAAARKRYTDAHGPILDLPLVREPTAIVYRLDGVDRAEPLRLSPDTLARIFTHRIVAWNDPAIRRDNPRRALPATPIVAYQNASRADALRLAAYLTQATGHAWPPGATAGEMPSMGITLLDARRALPADPWVDGAITFVGPGIAEASHVAVAELRGARGRFVAPTPDAVRRGDYPLATTRSLLVAVELPDAATADAVRAYATWLMGDGLAIFERLGYARLPEATTRDDLAKLAQLTVKAAR